jgi:hypothetical protein
MRARPRVGVVMRDRILSSADDADDVAFLDLERDVVERPDMGPRSRLAGAERHADQRRERVAQRAVLLDFGADDVALAEIVGANGGIGQRFR